MLATPGGKQAMCNDYLGHSSLARMIYPPPFFNKEIFKLETMAV